MLHYTLKRNSLVTDNIEKLDASKLQSTFGEPGSRDKLLEAVQSQEHAHPQFSGTKQSSASPTSSASSRDNNSSMPTPTRKKAKKKKLTAAEQRSLDKPKVTPVHQSRETTIYNSYQQ